MTNLETDRLTARTPSFRIPRATFAVRMVALYGKWWLAVLLVLFVAAVVAGIVADLRFLVVGLMVLFIVFPMVVAFLYFKEGLRRECAMNVVEHFLDIDGKGIGVNLLKPREADVDEEEESDTEEVIARLYFRKDNLLPPESFANEIIWPLREGGFIWISGDILEASPDFKENLELLIIS